MRGLVSRIRQPVQREGAERYLRLTLLSFAASVLVTRLFLQLTGYPQLGDRHLHIAHVLWGGLLLYLAALLPVLLANRAVYTVGALLSGIGIGLFIDEVGKFITQTNDYFYPAAAPIIYAFFLLSVLLYLRVRRPPVREVRAELYRALDGLSEVLDHDLDARERASLEVRLAYVAQQAHDPELARLAQALLAFVTSDAVSLAGERPGRWQRWEALLSAAETRWLQRRWFKMLLVVGFVLEGAGGVIDLAQLVAPLVTHGASLSPSLLALTSLRTMLEACASVPLLMAAALVSIGQERHGLLLGYFSLLLWLGAVNLVVFYFDQFHAVSNSVLQLALVLAVVHYRRRYLISSMTA